MMEKRIIFSSVSVILLVKALFMTSYGAFMTEVTVCGMMITGTIKPRPN
jgi:hypothetical protein